MARLSTFLWSLPKMDVRSCLTLAIVGVGMVSLLATHFLVPLPAQGIEPASGHSTAAAMHDSTLNAHDLDARHRSSKSVAEPEDNRLQVHAHHAEPLGEQAYKDAPADVVLWGDLARALVVRKGSTYETTFLPPVLARDGKTISIVGHVTAVTGKDMRTKQFLLSSHAFMCEECEPPAPTELVEVNTKDLARAKEGTATIRGQFEVVRNDPKGLAYRLNNAIILKQDAH